MDTYVKGIDYYREFYYFFMLKLKTLVVETFELNEWVMNVPGYV